MLEKVETIKTSDNAGGSLLGRVVQSKPIDLSAFLKQFFSTDSNRNGLLLQSGRNSSKLYLSVYLCVHRSRKEI